MPAIEHDWVLVAHQIEASYKQIDLSNSSTRDVDESLKGQGKLFVVANIKVVLD